MRIGVDARPLAYPKAGIAVYLDHLLDVLQQYDNKNTYYLISNAPIDFQVRNPKWHKVEGRFRKKMLSTLWMQLITPFCMIKYKLDLFWSPRHHLPVFMPRRVKSVLTIHDLVHRLYPHTMPLTHLIVDRLFMGLSIRKADRIIAVSKATSAAIRKSYRVNDEKMKTIYHGVPKLKHKIKRMPDLPAKYFLFVGTLEPRKNIERTVKAFQSVVSQNHNVHLVIVGGKGWKNHPFHRLIRSNPLNRYIHLTDYITPDKLSSVYANAIGLVYPSLCEGFGFPILEAMSIGIPVITSDCSSMAEIAGDAAVLVDPLNADAIAEAMVDILIDSNLYKRLIAKGKVRSRQISWQRGCMETLKVLEEAIGH